MINPLFVKLNHFNTHITCEEIQFLFVCCRQDVSQLLVLYSATWWLLLLLDCFLRSPSSEEDGKQARLCRCRRHPQHQALYRHLSLSPSSLRQGLMKPYIHP